MEPVSTAVTAAEIYKAAGIIGVLLFILVVGLVCVWRSVVNREKDLQRRLTKEAEACREREHDLGQRLRQVENFNREDLKAALTQANAIGSSCAEALGIAARAFQKLSDSPSGAHRALDR